MSSVLEQEAEQFALAVAELVITQSEVPLPYRNASPEALPILVGANPDGSGGAYASVFFNLPDAPYSLEVASHLIRYGEAWVGAICEVRIDGCVLVEGYTAYYNQRRKLIVTPSGLN